METGLLNARTPGPLNRFSMQRKVATAMAVVIIGIVLLAVLQRFKSYLDRTKDYSDVVIDDSGEYILGDNKKLSVWTDEMDFVQFRLEIDGKTVIEFEDKASDYQTYRLLWESNAGRLWFDSSDVGSIVYVHQSENSYMKLFVVRQIDSSFAKPQMRITDVPLEVRQKLRL